MIRLGGRYTFKGFKATDGFAEVRWENLISAMVEPGSACKFFLVLIVRTGHPLDGKEVPFSSDGKHIGCWRAQLPDLDQEIVDGTV